jgi:hypothetical protein
MFQILVIETGGKHEIELCRVGTHPQSVVKALKNKRRWLSKDKTRSEKLYTSVRVERISERDR